MPDDPRPDSAPTRQEPPISGVEDTIAPPEDDSDATSAELMATSHPEDMRELRPIGHDYYTVGPELARGGMGRIRYGRDRRHGRPVAIKELLLTGEAAQRRFEREALITARLEHPSIVPVYEAGTSRDGRPFFAMKIVSGPSLATVLAETQRFEERTALLPTMIAVSEAIAYAHSKNVVHRDLKPANILVGRFGETVVIDWGLAKDLGDPLGDDTLPPAETPGSSQDLTIAGTAMGTPGYMPPEQARGEPVDRRADVYALGATLYHLLGGIAPYADESTGRDALTALRKGPPTPLGEVEPRVPADLQQIVAKAMEREPDDRYTSAQELAEELRQFQTGNLVDAYDYSRIELVGRWIARHRGLLLAALIIIAAGVATTAYFLRREQSLLGASHEAEELAESQRARLLQDKGRVELLSGRPLPALAYLSEAYALGSDSVALHALIAEATRSLDAIDATIEKDRVVVHAAELSPDGRHVLTATDSGAFLRDASSGDVVKLIAQGSRAWSAGFSETGNRFAVATWDRPAEVWDASALERIATLPEPVDWLALSRDGARLVTRKADAVAIWDAATGAPLASIEPPGRLHAISHTRDAQRVVTVGDDGVARAFDGDGKELASFGDDVSTATPSPDGALVATGHADGSAGIWNARTGQRLGTMLGHRRAVTTATFSRDGSLLLTAGDDGDARVWSTRGYAEVARLRGHRARITGARFSHDDTRVITTSRDWTAKIWNARSGKLLLSLEYGAEVATASFSPDGLRVIAAGDRGARIWTLQTGQLVARMQGHVAGLDLAAFGPEPSRIATAGRDGTATLFDADGGDRIGALAHAGPITALRFGSDGARLLTASRDGTAKLWDADSGLRIATFEVGHPVLAVGMRGGSQVVTVDATGAVLAWPAEGGAGSVALASIQGEPSTAAVDPAGDAVATAGEHSRTALVTRLDDGRSIELTGHRDSVVGAAFSPDGARLVTAGLDSTARVWDATTGAQLAVLAGHDGPVSSAAFDATGDRVVTASDDGTARIWDAGTGDHLVTLDGHERPVKYAVFDSDGNRVITASDDGAAILWDTHLDTRSRREIRALAARHCPWRVDGAALVPVR